MGGIIQCGCGARREPFERCVCSPLNDPTDLEEAAIKLSGLLFAFRRLGRVLVVYPREGKPEETVGTLDVQWHIDNGTLVIEAVPHPHT